MEAIKPIAVATALILGAKIAFTFFSNYFRQQNKKPQSKAHHHHSHADKMITWRSLKRIRSRKSEHGHDCLIPTLLFTRHGMHNLFQSSDFPSSQLNSNEVPMETIFRGIRLLVSYAYFYDYKKDGQERIGAFSSLISLADLLKLVELSHGDDRRHVMLDALRALSIILSSMTREHFVADAVRGGVIGLLLPISEFPTATSFTREVVLSLGNICATSSHYRDIVLRKGGMMAFLTLLDATDIGMNRIVTRAISNICYGKPQPLFDEIKVCLPVLRNFLEVSTDLEVRSNVCWTLSFMSNTSNKNINFIVQSGISHYLLEINEPSLIFPTLLAVGNILTGNDSECDSLLELGLLPWLQTVASIGLKKKKTSLCSSVCWAISNIVCRGENYVQVVVNGGFVQTLIKVLESNPRSKVMKHATNALSYVADFASDSASSTYSNRLFFDLLALINSSSPRLLLVCLKYLRKLVGEEHPAVGGEAYNSILKLLTHDDPEIRDVAKELVILVGRA